MGLDSIALTAENFGLGSCMYLYVRYTDNGGACTNKVACSTMSWQMHYSLNGTFSVWMDCTSSHHVLYSYVILPAWPIFNGSTGLLVVESCFSTKICFSLINLKYISKFNFVRLVTIDKLTHVGFIELHIF